jgi:ribonuclease HII
MLKSSFTSLLIEAGCDEAGRGCLAGPVVAAAVVLPADFRHPELDDSKKLSPAQREKISRAIRYAAIDFQIAEVDNREIDRINILEASILAMHRAIEGLRDPPGLILIDGNRFHPYGNIPHHCIVKGDAIFASIAAASVLAKHHRDQLMRELAREYPQYGWERNFGYPTTEHRKAIQHWGPTKYHRMTFRFQPLN